MGDSGKTEAIRGTTEGRMTYDLTPPQTERAGGQIRKKNTGLIGMHQARCDTATIQRAPQPIIIFNVNWVEPSIPTNAAEAKHNMDRSLVHWWDNQGGAAHHGKAVTGQRVTSTLQAAELNGKSKITAIDDQGCQTAGDNRVNTISTYSVHPNNQVNRQIIHQMYFQIKFHLASLTTHPRHTVDINRKVDVADSARRTDAINPGGEIVAYRDAWNGPENETFISQTQIGAVIQKRPNTRGLGMPNAGSKKSWS